MNRKHLRAVITHKTRDAAYIKLVWCRATAIVQSQSLSLSTSPSIVCIHVETDEITRIWQASHFEYLSHKRLFKAKVIMSMYTSRHRKTNTAFNTRIFTACNYVHPYRYILCRASLKAYRLLTWRCTSPLLCIPCRCAPRINHFHRTDLKHTSYSAFE